MKFNFKIIALFFIFFCFSGYGQQDTTSFVYKRSYKRLKEKGLSDLEAKNYIKESDSLYMRLFKEDMQRLEDENLVYNAPPPPSTNCTDIPDPEKEVLFEIYNNLNGATGTWATGWDFSPNAAPVTSWNPVTQTGWRGITVVNCHVVAINFFVANGGFFSSLEGTFPDISNLTFLNTLVINNGQWYTNDYMISGGNLASIGNLSYLKTLNLRRVNFNGEIPINFIQLTDTLEELTLYDCNLSEISQLQTLIPNFTNLKILSLSKNYSNGDSFPLPNGFSNLSNLERLQFNLSRINDANILSQITGLKRLYISENELTQIPNLSNHSGLRIFHIASNQIQGSVPPYFQNMSFEEFRITNNLFEGDLPFINATRELHIYLNKFKFKDFTPEFVSYNSIQNLQFWFSPQSKTDQIETQNVTLEQNVHMEMFTNENHYSGDTYQWFKNGSLIPNAVSKIYTFTAQSDSGGVYTCKSYHLNPPITNYSATSFKNLVLERQPITLNIVEPTPCDDCTSFELLTGEKYVISGWVKEANESGVTNNNVYNYTNSSIEVSFVDVNGTLINSAISFLPTGAIIDGWQQIKGEFTVPSNVDDMKIELVNDNMSLSSFFDDIRVHPFNGNLKSFVYDQASQRLMAELDENNYATFYEYDKEGGLVRVKKETERGVYTIQESRSSTQKKD
jgi:hypothetical protein